MSKEQAMQQYVSCVNALDPDGSSKVLIETSTCTTVVNKYGNICTDSLRGHSWSSITVLYKGGFLEA